MLHLRGWWVDAKQLMELEAQGDEVTLAQARAWFRALAEAWAEAPIHWAQVEETAHRDLDSGTPLVTWTDAARGPDPTAPPCYTLRVGAVNGEGNPRDGYGYQVFATLLGPAGETLAHARNTGYLQTFSPFHVEMAGLDLARWEAARRVLGAVLPHLRDTSVGERTLPGMTARLLLAGRDDDARALLAAWAAAPLAPPSYPSTVARLCEQAAALGLLDRALAERWVTAAASAPAAWAFLARAGGGAGRSADDAWDLAWRADPWPVAHLRDGWERASEAGREAIRQVCALRSDPRLRWRPGEEVPDDPWVLARASEARRGPAHLLALRRPDATPDFLRALAARRGLPTSAVSTHTTGPPPGGPAGTYTGAGIAPSWAGRTTWVWPAPAGDAAFATLLRTNAADQALHLGLLVTMDGRWLRWSLAAGPAAVGGQLGVPHLLEWTCDDPSAWEPDLAAASRV
jgi:hypothetical protein